MNTIEVKPAGTDRMVPMPGKHREYFPHGVWTDFPASYELQRLIDSGDLVARPAEAGDPHNSEEH